MKMDELVTAVREMRRVQKEYFGGDRDKQRQARQAEILVDELLAGNPSQGSLFETTPPPPMGDADFALSLIHI